MTNVRKSLKSIAESWCNKHKIYIYATAITNSKCKIIIDFQGEKLPGKKTYKSTKIGAKDDVWWHEVDKLRMYYYDKFVNHPDYQ
jgi:hypothetical protein